MPHIKALAALALATLLAACTSAPPEAELPAKPAQDPLMEMLNNRQAAAEPPFFNQAAAPVAQTGFLANPNVQAFIQYQHQHNGLPLDYLNNFFAQVNYRGNLINTMNRPATTQPWYKFAANNSGSLKISAGRAFYAQNRAAIDRAAQQYGVPAELIVAIIGIETQYGKNSGSIRVADSLATLAFDYPRRGAFFQKELGEFLQLAQQENRDPFSFTGSFAGAMGMPQFIPSSFRQYAVDFDGDHQRNIWSSVPDVAASVANYMKQHGWQTGKPMLIGANVAQETPQIQALLNEKTALNHTVGQLRQMGVQPLGSVADSEPALLYRLETAPNQYQYYIGLNNFYTVWHYNHSRMYVTAVRDIANGMGGGL